MKSINMKKNIECIEGNNIIESECDYKTYRKHVNSECGTPFKLEEDFNCEYLY